MNTALAHMRAHPEELERTPTDTMRRLQEYLKTNGQGTGNKVTAHEACVAECLEAHGFVLTPRGTTPTADGLYYWYQLQGSQQAGDFLVFEVVGGVKTFERILDAKHSNGMSIYLNDGTFEPGTIYIVSFTRCLDRIRGQRKKPRQNVCFLGCGEDIFTDTDREAMTRWRSILRDINQTATDTDHLRLYARSANQYNCDRFTPEFADYCWSRIPA